MKFLLSLLCIIAHLQLIGQFGYEPGPEYPFGRPHPDAPQQIKDFEALIGTCNCKSVSLNQDQTWSDPVDMTWTWKYIMNGMAVQDETLKADGKHSGSIRQYIQDSAQWYVHYYSSASPSSILPTWTGGKEGEDIVLYRSQKAPNGAEGYYRLTFYEIDDQGYKWIGEWVDLSESIVFPTWKISCVRE